jgi:hypothetical protein
MRTYIFAVFNRHGKRVGNIDFGLRPEIPTHEEIVQAIRETFISATTYKLVSIK